jgi:hypothetical protein
VGAPRNVSKGLVNRNPLDEGVKSFSTLMAAAQPLVIAEMPADKDQLLKADVSSPVREDHASRTRHPSSPGA